MIDDYVQERLAELRSRARKTNHGINEEAAKQSLVLPFLRALGYDIEDTTEVQPEYRIQGRSVDYAIVSRSRVWIAIECKRPSAQLGIKEIGQLAKYVDATGAQYGVLTNGFQYQCFRSQTDAPGMDDEPFLKFDISRSSDRLATDIRVLLREEVIGVTPRMREAALFRQMVAVLDQQFVTPEGDFVRWLAGRVGDEPSSPAEDRQFRERTRRALNEVVHTRLRVALHEMTGRAVTTGAVPAADRDPSSAVRARDGIVTTIEEIKAHAIVQSILNDVVDPNRVVLHDAPTYCSILLDGDEARPICQLQLSDEHWSLLAYDRSGYELRWQLQGLDDIRKYAHHLRLATMRLDA